MLRAALWSLRTTAPQGLLSGWEMWLNHPGSAPPSVVGLSARAPCRDLFDQVVHGAHFYKIGLRTVARRRLLLQTFGPLDLAAQPCTCKPSVAPMYRGSPSHQSIPTKDAKGNKKYDSNFLHIESDLYGRNSESDTTQLTSAQQMTPEGWRGEIQEDSGRSNNQQTSPKTGKSVGTPLVLCR